MRSAAASSVSRFLQKAKRTYWLRVVAVVIEARSRYRRHAAFPREPEREVDVAQVAQLGKIGQDVIRAFGKRELEAGRGQGLDDQVTAEPVVARQMIEILGVERIADRGGGLERRGRADGQEVVDLPNRVRRLGRGDRVAEAPARATECLRQTGDGDRPLAHSGPRGDRVMLARVRDVFVRVVGEHHHIVFDAERCDERDLVPREHAPGGIVRRVQDERARPRREGRAQPVGVEGPGGRVERDEDGLRPGQDAIRSVVLVKRLRDDDLIAGIDQGEEGRRHGFGPAAGDRHLALRVHLHVVHPPVLLGDREPQDRAAPGDRVLVDIPPDGGACRLLHRFGHREVREALREVDGAVGLGDPRHLADDGFLERGRSVRRTHAVSPFCSGGRRSSDKLTSSPSPC